LLVIHAIVGVHAVIGIHSEVTVHVVVGVHAHSTCLDIDVHAHSSSHVVWLAHVGIHWLLHGLLGLHLHLHLLLRLHWLLGLHLLLGRQHGWRRWTHCHGCSHGI
jgi:hypothetical protein